MKGIIKFRLILCVDDCDNRSVLILPLFFYVQSMQTLIIALNIRQAEFIKKGFKYENLSADVVSIDLIDKIDKYIPFYDGIFILSDSIEHIIKLSTVCREISCKIPIFCLAQKFNDEFVTLENDKVISQFFLRPFAFRSIVSEMRFAIFQIKENIEKSNYVIRDLELDILKHQVKHKDQLIQLRNKEFSLLHFMMINAGKVLSRTTILENVWDRNANILTNTVDVHISQLRKKIEKDTEQKYIHTIPCSGYILS